MEALESSVRVVVKAPNQQIDDQIVECTLGWTVQKLKKHLSEVYPNKPPTEEQKLIYSGQLLHDHLVLKDFLRQYDNEQVHTVHLVCLPSTNSTKPTSNSRMSTFGNSDVGSGGSSRSNDSHLLTSANPTFGDERPHRSTNVSSQPTTHPFLDPRFNATMMSPQSTTTNFAYPPMMADQFAQQMAWMQQVYGHYVTSYFQQLHGFGELPAPEVPQPHVSNDSIMTNNQATPPVIGTPVNNAPAAPVAANENVRMNAQGGPVDDDDEDGGANGRRWDWLDWMYVISRVTILFSIVYFYSSLSRFFMVTVIALFIYLYQMGLLNVARPRHRPHPHPEVARPREQPEPDLVNDVDAAVADENGENGDTEQMERETREIEELMNHGMENVARGGDRVTAIGIWMWTLVSTFFTSLLPQTPAPGNFN